MFCRFCGKEAQDGQKFCPYCGKKDDTIVYITQPVSTVAPTPAPTVNAAPIQQNTTTAPAEQKKKKSKLPIIIIALLLVVAIVAGVIFVPGLLKGKEEDKEKEQTVSETTDEYTDESSEGKEESNEGNTDADANEDGTVTVWVLKEIAFSEEAPDWERIEYDYDEYGRVLVEKLYEVSQKGVTCHEWRSITYNDQGKIDRYTIEDYYSMEQEYDENGNITEVILYVDSDIYCHYFYEYDENGNLKRRTAKEGSVEYTETEYQYNEDGGLIKETHYWEDGSVSSLYEYDGQGNHVKDTLYYDGKLYNVTLYENGLKSEEREYDSDGNEYIKYVCRYDSEGRLVEKTEYDAESGGNSSFTNSYKYNESGQLVEVIYTDGYSRSVSSDGDQEVVETCYYGAKVTCEYDENGRLIAVKYFELDEEDGVTTEEFGHDVSFKYISFELTLEQAEVAENIQKEVGLDNYIEAMFINEKKLLW